MKGDAYERPLFRCMAEERERILSILQEVLTARGDVLFAYVYGSFEEGSRFHDIDVGVYLTEGCDREDLWIDVELAEYLEQAVWQAQIACRPGRNKGARRPRIPVDVRVLNKAPTTFGYHVLRGRLLFSRDESIRVSWTARIVSRYLDLKPLRHAALKEAMISWD